MRVFLLVVGIVLGLMAAGCASTGDGKAQQCEDISAAIIALNKLIADPDTGEPLADIQADIDRWAKLAQDIGCVVLFPPDVRAPISAAP